ncbi:phosphate acetyltransferase [soil metagenome]
MKALDEILERARSLCPRIVLSEGEDPRVVAAAARAQADGLARPILVGDPDRIAAIARGIGCDRRGLETLDPRRAPLAARYAADYEALRRHKGVDAAAAARAVADPLVFAAMMVRAGDADGTVGGATATTADTVRAALQVIGSAPGIGTVSSFFLMMLCEPHHATRGALLFADCALVVEPSVNQLADIAIASARSYRVLTGDEPRVAMLSFSTSGSARHPRVQHVRDATARASALSPDLLIDGDLQFDAAFVPVVSETKAKLSPLKGLANVLIFPDLEAANIGYKIAQRIGKARAIGPVLQGLACPANDLSRGCTAEDVYHLIAVTAVQTGQAEHDGAPYPA